METNETNKDKLIGYGLLILGLMMIGYSLISVYNTFTTRQDPIQLFNFDPIAVDLSTFIDGPPPPGVNLTQTLVQADLINTPLNLAAHLLLMGFVSSTGYKVSRLGTMLIRAIKLHVSQEKEGVKILAK